MAIQSYSWFKTTSQSAYAQIEARRTKLHAYNQYFLESSNTLTETLASASITQASGMATLAAKMATKRVMAALQAKIAAATDSASSVDMTV